MPKTKTQDIVYTILMVLVMVYGMVCYNIALHEGGLHNQTFFLALQELPIMGVLAFLLEFLFVGKVSQKLAFQLIDPKKDKPIFITLAISTIIVLFMCPLMSLFATIFFNFHGFENIIATWIQTAVLNFPMALCFQLFYAGPLVRFLFRFIFKHQLNN